MAQHQGQQVWRAGEEAPLFFETQKLSADSEYLPHSHSWGQVLNIRSGVLILYIGTQRLLAPPGFVIWIPGGVEYSCYNSKKVHLRTINIHPHFCDQLPNEACLLQVNAIFCAILSTCFTQNMQAPETEADRRLCRVLIDQLVATPAQHTYLPGSNDKYLAPILRHLEQNPGDNTSFSEWAKRVFTTERTLTRRAQTELGMSFGEWRQRLRFLHAISLLERGKTVQEIALEVGYSSSSAFITMFQQLAGTTPERYRHFGPPSAMDEVS